jgi:hypothetical protein
MTVFQKVAINCVEEREPLKNSHSSTADVFSSETAADGSLKLSF